MTKQCRWLPLAALLPLVACTSAPKPAPAPSPAPMTLTDTDATFIEKAARSNDFIIATAKLADSQARDPHVKTFATRLISDHTTSQDRLKAIAERYSMTLPEDLNTDEDHVLASLKTEKGHAFDRDFIALQIATHDDAGPLFQAEATGGSDPALKTYAADMQAAIRSHLDMANSLDQHRPHRRPHH